MPLLYESLSSRLLVYEAQKILQLSPLFLTPLLRSDPPGGGSESPFVQEDSTARLGGYPTLGRWYP